MIDARRHLSPFRHKTAKSFSALEKRDAKFLVFREEYNSTGTQRGRRSIRRSDTDILITIWGAYDICACAAWSSK
jgi:hypothetical protein